MQVGQLMAVSFFDKIYSTFNFSSSSQKKYLGSLQ